MVVTNAKIITKGLVINILKSSKSDDDKSLYTQPDCMFLVMVNGIAIMN